MSSFYSIRNLFSTVFTITWVIGIKLLSEQIAESLAITGKGRQNVPIKICSYEECARVQKFQIRKKFL